MSDLKNIFKNLGLVAHHIAHWGRVAGPREAKFKELSAELIRVLGNWDRDTLDARYSTKIPLQAGFEKDDSYWLPRSRLVPCKELLSYVWPWIEDEEKKIIDDPELGSTSRPTVLHFLRCLKFLCEVILQDVAAIIVILESMDGNKQLDLKVRARQKLTHNIFSIPVFQSNEFLSFKESMRNLLNAIDGGDGDPNRMAINKFLPGVTKMFMDVFGQLAKLHEEQSALESKVEECITWLGNHVEERLDVMYKQQESRTQHIIKSLSSFFKEGVESGGNGWLRKSHSR